MCILARKSSDTWRLQNLKFDTMPDLRTETHAGIHCEMRPLQSLDWTSGLDWWTDTKDNFTLSNETHSPMELCGTLQPSL